MSSRSLAEPCVCLWGGPDDLYKTDGDYVDDDDSFRRESSELGMHFSPANRFLAGAEKAHPQTVELKIDEAEDQSKRA